MSMILYKNVAVKCPLKFVSIDMHQPGTGKPNVISLSDSLVICLHQW